MIAETTATDAEAILFLHCPLLWHIRALFFCREGRQLHKLNVLSSISSDPRFSSFKRNIKKDIFNILYKKRMNQKVI
jgi:hypothetical protein